MRAVAIILALSAGAVQADEADVVRLRAMYLAGPTEWCAADEGVPYIMTVEGPNLHASTFALAPKASVRVRRGSATVEDVDVAHVDPGEIRTRRGNEARTSGTVNGPRLDELQPIGRFQARLNVCDTPWWPVSIIGPWAVEADDGTVVFSGEADERYFWGDHPLLSLRSNFPQSVRLDGQAFVVMRKPEYIRTTEAFVSPAEEQDQ